jgi:hypothetical protein
MWFKLNNLVVNVGKMMAMSSHTLQNKKPDIQYKMETKFLGIYVNENVKWNSHIK